ncbi:MAG: hypothetical protein RLZZ450_1640 [Pseudomonadota bacterium]
MATSNASPRSRVSRAAETSCDASGKRRGNISAVPTEAMAVTARSEASSQ